ncbi:MAG: hypothetical protein JO353_06820 [Phycisphaerae bacterium]|nr:hypothetical protein [Phycisphaerae bacterium]
MRECRFLCPSVDLPGVGCWVAPSIAAELWGMSLSDVMALICNGALATQRNNGFSFISLPTFARPGQSIPIEQRPATFNIVPAAQPTPADDSSSVGDDESELGPPPDEHPNDNRIAYWRSGRRATSARRKPPGSNLQPTAK